MYKRQVKNGGLDQYGAEPFKQQQFRTAGVEGVKGSPGSEAAMDGEGRGKERGRNE